MVHAGRLKILYLSTGYGVHDRRFLEKITSAGHEAIFVSWDGASATAALPEGARGLAFVATSDSERQREIAAIATDVGASLIHAGPVPTVAYHAIQSGFRPVLAMSWGSDLLVDAREDATAQARANLVLSQAAGLICDSEAVAAVARELSGISQDQITIFPWGTEPEHFSPAADSRERLRARLGWQDAFVIFTNRSWEPIYSVPTALDAFAQARKANPALKLLLAGAGSEAAAVHESIRRHGLEPHVHFAGRVSREELPAYYAASELYLSCALSDGTSVSLLEAMSCGVPALVTDIPSNREWVAAGANGWLAARADAGAYARAISEAALLAPGQLRAMGQRGREQVLARADWKRESSRLLEAYRRITK